MISEEAPAGAGLRWDRGRTDTGGFVEEEGQGWEGGRPMGAGWAMEACRAGSGGGESGFQTGRVGGDMVGGGDEGTERRIFQQSELHVGHLNRHGML